MLALGVFQHFCILKENMGKGINSHDFGSRNGISEHILYLLSWEASDPEVILLATTNYLEKLASKEFGNKLGLTKVVDQFFQQRGNGRMPRSPS